jgi:L-ascorbate metabolism protein UlaG (beta-lactamase superfamily)
MSMIDLPEFLLGEGQQPDQRRRRIHASPQWAGRAFANREPSPLVGWRDVGPLTRESLNRPRATRRPPAPLRGVVPDMQALRRGPEPSAAWLGHSTVLLQVDGVVFLTDPVWGERASPLGFAGPRRFQPPVAPLRAVWDVDAVLLTHDHYDHFCTETLQVLARETTLPFVCPLGVGPRLLKLGVTPDRIVELDWWESTRVDGVQVVATPARHFSGRGVHDRNRTLWASWSLVGPHHRVFFGGDTGLGEHFAEVLQRVGLVDLALLEIGAWHRAWGTIHLGPAGALDALEALGRPPLLPIHWGVFDLGLHPWQEPIEDLTVEAARRNLRLSTPRLGEVVQAGAHCAPWWRELLQAGKPSA